MNYKFKDGLVSIIMPTYNVSSFVRNTIESILAQTYDEWELIIIDDCSSDDTPSILKSISSLDDRIKVIYSSVNGGAGVSRNLGIEVAKGRYLSFLDSDDLWDENKLDLQIKHMKINNAPISHTTFSFIDEFGYLKSGKVQVSKLIDLEENLRRTEIGTSTAMIDRYIIKENIQFSTIRARQDIKLWISLLSLGYKSFGLDKPLVKYRVRNGSVSSNKFKMLYITFRVYMQVNELTLTKRLSCYFSYIGNAIKKRA